MESIESVILNHHSITIYHSQGPLTFHWNAKSQRTAVLKTVKL